VARLSRYYFMTTPFVINIYKKEFISDIYLVR